jgi:polysaccharide export outer membrane protein
MKFEIKQVLRGYGKLTGVFAALLLLCFCAIGCGAASIDSSAELRAFEKAGPVRPVANVDELLKAKIPAGPYRVVADDVLELHMPIITQALFDENITDTKPVLCRVDKTGDINLPIVGKITVIWKTLGEIEAAVVEAYYPKYVKRIPSVTAKVSDYHTVRVSVVGVVEYPGIYDLRSNERSLVAALMKAGGIIPEGAGAIKIHTADPSDNSEPIFLPIKGLNIPFTDVKLKGGETIEVREIAQANFTVVGLVNDPGVFPYPPGIRYTLAQALAIAGGLDAVGDPQYAKVVRQDASGKLVVVPFKIGGSGLTDSASIVLRPGDVIAIERTARTETRRILVEVLNVGLGFGVGLSKDI